MTDFNPIQIITRIANNVLSNQSIQNNGANSAQNAMNTGVNSFSQNFQPQTQNNTPMFFKFTPLTLSAASELKLTTIEIEQKANYAKDLLNLPRDFSELINQITSNSTQTSIINQQMLSELSKLFNNGKIDLSLLSILLKDTSKDAMQKLMMTIANIAKYGANDVSGLKELMNLFSANTAIVSDSQALKNLLLLYLPWLPLSQRAENDLDFTIDIFDKIQGPDPDKEEPLESVKILIQTNNFANVIAVLDMTPLGQIDIDVSAGKDFPHKRVMELIKEESSLNNVKSNVSIGTSKNAESNSESESTEAYSVSSYGNVKITSSGSISPKLMLMAQSLIKIIIQLDYEENIIKRNNECSQGADDESVTGT